MDDCYLRNGPHSSRSLAGARSQEDKNWGWKTRMCKGKVDSKTRAYIDAMMKSMVKALKTGETHAPREMRILRIDDSLRTCGLTPQ
jgi:hypothetical protein